jgi:putative salt-induced outer membrane protein YdiY
MKGKGIVFLFTVLLLFFICGQAAADEVWLKNGDRLTGKVVSLEAGTLTFKTSYAGDLSIKWEEVANLKTDESIKVVLSDETAAQGPVSPGEGGEVTVKAEQVAQPITVNLSAVKTINPKPRLRTTLRINFGGTRTSGNTDTLNAYGEGEFVVRMNKSRFSLGGNYQRAEDNGVTTANSAMGQMKYEYFFAEKWYAYANATGEKNKFKDLNLRATLGLGAGYQFLQSEFTNLSLDGGLSYANEDFDVAEDNSYAAARWGIRFDHYFLDKSVQFFSYNTGLQSVENSEDLTIYTQTGFRIPFYKNLNITAQMNWEYDKSPAPGREDSDYTYILSLGYLWAN